MVLTSGIEKEEKTVRLTPGDEAVYMRLALNLQDNIGWNIEEGVRSWKKKETSFNTSS